MIPVINTGTMISGVLCPVGLVCDVEGCVDSNVIVESVVDEVEVSVVLIPEVVVDETEDVGVRFIGGP